MDSQSTLDMSRMIGDHTCLSVTSCGLHLAWPAMLPRGHKTARTKNRGMNLCSCLTIDQKHHMGGALCTTVQCWLSDLRIPTVLNFRSTR